MKHEIAALAAPEVADRLAAGAALVLPMGSLETHGPALPMGDYLLAAEIARLIAARAAGQGADALVLPTIPFGGEDFFTGIPGAVSLPGELLQKLVEAVLEQPVRRGVRRLMVVNGHGGSVAAVEAATRVLRHRHGIVVPALHLWRAAGALHVPLGGMAESLGHGGDPIASIAQHLLPALCRPERAQPRRPEQPFLGLPLGGFGAVRCGGVEFSVPIEIEEVGPGGVAAPDARGASAAHGAALTEALVAAGASMLVALRAEHP